MWELGVFARYWTPGAVKTRLAASIGDEAAASIYRCSVAATLCRFAATGQRRVLAFTPHEAETAFREVCDEQWKMRPQPQGDLGARMLVYFQQAFAAGAERVVLIGSDSPTLPVEYVASAFRCLEQVPVVLGPATDGGYYLIGLSQSVPQLFRDMPWSTPQLFERTIERLAEGDIAFSTLSAWHDFDTVDDLHRLRAELTSVVSREPVYLPLLAAIERALPPSC